MILCLKAFETQRIKGEDENLKRVVKIENYNVMSKIKMEKLEDGTEIPQFVHHPTIKEELPGAILGGVLKGIFNLFTK